MGEWFIEQKAKRSKLSQTSALQEIKSGSLLDRKREQSLIVFEAREDHQQALGIAEGDLLLIQCTSTGNAQLLRGVTAVGKFNGRETGRVRTYLRKHPEFGGILPVRVAQKSDIEETLDVTPNI